MRKNAIDLTGKKFGSWTVEEYLGHQKWLCKCECGTTKEVGGQSLRDGKSTSCGCKRIDILREKGLFVKPRPLRDITEQTFGYLTALERVEDERKGSYWLCRCVCGKKKIVNLSDLASGATKSCGCKIGELRRASGYSASKIDDLTGKRFGNLLVVELIPRNYNDPVKWICKCDCGNERICSSDDLKYEGVTKCKVCTRDSLNKRYPRLVRIYANMKQRCTNPNHDSYAVYGGKGVTICDEWMNSFDAFAEWAINNGYEDGLSIDRIDNEGNYEPSNCRWATRFEQANNTSQNVNITYNGETHSVAEWSRILNIHNSTLANRLKHGWSVKEAFETPPSKHNGKNKRVAVET